jgi:hypothetical protein
VTRRRALLQPVDKCFGPARVSDPKSHDGDRGFVVVLLEEHPLQHLRAVVPILRNEPRAFGEVPQNGS